MSDLSRLDLNQLADLDALLREGSVGRAAVRLHVSAPAMSRRLAHLRRTFGDPLFVLAGRGLVPTARALALQPQIAAVLDDARRVLAPQELDLARVERTVTLRANDGLLGAWAARLQARVASQAPGVRLCFMPRPDKDMTPLRTGELDLDIGVLHSPVPEVHTLPLLRANFVCAVRRDHPLATRRRLTVAHFVAFPHVVASRRGRSSGPIDIALRSVGARRDVRLIVPGFQAALEVAYASDLIATVPGPMVGWSALGERLKVFPLPVETPEIEVALSWHPRLHADPLQRWVREQVLGNTRPPAPR